MIVYLAMDTEGEIKYASENEEYVSDYIETYGYEAREGAMHELGMDEDADEKDLIEAEIQAGINGDLLKPFRVSLANRDELDEDEEITLEDGTELRVGDILDKLDECDEEDDD